MPTNTTILKVIHDPKNIYHSHALIYIAYHGPNYITSHKSHKLITINTAKGHVKSISLEDLVSESLVSVGWKPNHLEQSWSCWRTCLSKWCCRQIEPQMFHYWYWCLLLECMWRWTTHSAYQTRLGASIINLHMLHLILSCTVSQALHRPLTPYTNY